MARVVDYDGRRIKRNRSERVESGRIIIQEISK